MSDRAKQPIPSHSERIVFSCGSDGSAIYTFEFCELSVLFLDTVPFSDVVFGSMLG